MKLISRNIIVAFLILMLLAGAYSFLQGTFNVREEISLSDLVKKINAGEIKKVDVNGDELSVSLNDGSVLFSKKNPMGALFWISALLPFVLPFLLIVLFFWLAARQVQRANVQAFTFGQSRARIIQPDSKKERVTFREVAGAKEAKEELLEIVEFLKNPKK